MMERGELKGRKFDTVIYHANCPDGFGATWSVRHALGGAPRFEPGYSNRPVNPEAYRGQSVLLVDYCWNKQTIEAVLDTYADITIVDHHLTAMEEIGHQSLPSLTTYFDMDNSAAMLAWNAFHTEPAPDLIRHIEDYDLFRMALPAPTSSTWL